MKVRVYHQARGQRGFEDICIDIEMPFLPSPSLMIKPTEQSDFLEIDDVYWSVEDPNFVEVHIEQGGHIYPLKDYLAEGWRRA